jgi:hypothetical protein
LRVLDGQQRLGVGLRLGQRGLGGLQVQLDQLLDAFEGLVGQAEQGFEVGFLRGEELLGVSMMEISW